ncbi:MAG: substrate-binding domain-containing protein [Nitrospirales bacterium]|jgi:fructose transport system substrate-binding protein
MEKFDQSCATRTVLAATMVLAFGLAGGMSAHAQDVTVGLVTKTETNPFFVTMRNAARAKADELGVGFKSCAGGFDTDNEGQATCIENLIAAGVTGILLTPGVPDAIVPTIERAQAQGVPVIALDTQTNPSDAADATFATDNFQAGLFIGQWAAAAMGDAAADAVVGFLDVSSGLQITTEVQRNQGFMTGFGIDPVDNTFIGDENDSRIAGFAETQGSQDMGRTAMENLMAANPNINVIYTINEPAAAGAFEAIKAAGRADDILIVSVDGGCPGVQNVADGVIGATSMQFPLRMAKQGVQAIVDFAATGKLPAPSEGLEFTNTGVVLITDQPVEGIESQNTTWGLENCWG